jgi:hypothetical protein
MLRDKMTNQLMAPDHHTPFKSLHDVIARLLPYHMWSEAEPPPGAIDKGLFLLGTKHTYTSACMLLGAPYEVFFTGYSLNTEQPGLVVHFCPQHNVYTAMMVVVDPSPLAVQLMQCTRVWPKF